MALREIDYKDSKFQIHYDLINPKKSPTLVFLHGWGSSKELMKSAFGDFFGDFKHLYIDMPGFGKSPNETVLTTDDYAKIIDLFLSNLNIKKEFIFGHSFGGKVATLLHPSHLILLSSAGIPVEKPLKVRLKIKLFKLLKPFGAKRFAQLFASKDVENMSQNMYETFKNVVDEDFSKHFRSYNGKALLFWGKEDTATPLFTAEKINSIIENSKLYPMDGDHYFFLKNQEKIEQKFKKEFGFDN